MKCFLALAATLTPGLVHTQALEPLRGSASITELIPPKRARLYQQLSDTSNPQAALRQPYRLTVQVVQPINARWILVVKPNYHRCKQGVHYPPDPTYYISTATFTEAKRSVLL